MKKLSIVLMGAVLSMAVQAATGPGKVSDQVRGGAKADFKTDELTIPCVKVASLSADT